MEYGKIALRGFSLVLKHRTCTISCACYQGRRFGVVTRYIFTDTPNVSWVAGFSENGAYG